MNATMTTIHVPNSGHLTGRITTMRRTLITAALVAAVAATVPATSAEARSPQQQRTCFPSTATMRLTATIPVVPGYCLLTVRDGKQQPGTVNRGVIKYRGKGQRATVTIYRAGAWHWYEYKRSSTKGWSPVTQEFADALAEGESSPPESADTRDWEACVTNATRTVVVCPDGFVTRQ